MAYDPEQDMIEQEEKQRDDSLTKLRRDRGKMEELICKLTIALEKRGGKVEHLNALLSETDDCININLIADYLMGVREMVRIDPVRIVTETGKSDRVRADAVEYIPADELPWEILTTAESGISRTRVYIAVRLTDRTALKEVALEGGKADSCIAARKLESDDDLYEVALQGQWNTTAFEILKRLPFEKLADFVHDCKEGQRVMSAVRRITDTEVLWWVTRYWGELGRLDSTTDPNSVPCSYVSDVTMLASERLKELVLGGAPFPPSAVI